MVLLLGLFVLYHKVDVIDVFEDAVFLIFNVEDESFEFEKPTSEANHGQSHNFLVVVCEVDSLSHSSLYVSGYLQKLYPGWNIAFSNADLNWTDFIVNLIHVDKLHLTPTKGTLTSTMSCLTTFWSMDSALKRRCLYPCLRNNFF